MLAERREQIKQYILQSSAVHVDELARLFPTVSAMTIRRDLAALEEQGYIIRTRGGARANSRAFGLSEELYAQREISNVDAKAEICAKALRLMEDSRSIFFDSGTTLMMLAKMMPDRNLTLFTTGPNIGLEVIMRTQNPQVTLLGGNLSRATLSSSGAGAREFLKTVNIDVAFMGTSGFSMSDGFTSGNPYESELKADVCAKARRTIMLMDTTKIGMNMPYTFARLEDIDVLVCERSPGAEIEYAAAQCGTEII